MRIFLTGATGFIGGRVADRLLARGDELVILARDPAKARRFADAGATVVTGDLTDGPAIARGVEGADAVLHVAADYRVGIPASEREALLAANVHGTELVLDAAIAAGVARIVHVSTGNVFGNTGDVVAEEGYQRDLSKGFLSVYDETKYLAHQAALERIRAGAPVLIAQPGAVYGPGDTSQVGNLIEQTRAGKMRLLMFPEFTLDYVHVDDMADGLILVLDRGRIGESYVLGGEAADMRTLVTTVAELSGRKPPTRALPSAAIRAGIPFGRLIGPLMGFPPNLGELVRTSDGVQIRMTDAKARRELGYRTRSLRDGLRETLAADGSA
jgi:nucleoside-diphosphate-sugar epimerase